MRQATCAMCISIGRNSRDISNANIIPENERNMRRAKCSLLLCFLCSFTYSLAQKPASTVFLLKPAQVFDGESMHTGWAVLVRDDRIASVGPSVNVRAPAEAKSIELGGATLMPGLIEAHSHVLLHPYNETSWNDQNA